MTKDEVMKYCINRLDKIRDDNIHELESMILKQGILNGDKIIDIIIAQHDEKVEMLKKSCDKEPDDFYKKISRDNLNAVMNYFMNDGDDDE